MVSLVAMHKEKYISKQRFLKLTLVKDSWVVEINQLTNAD